MPQIIDRLAFAEQYYQEDKDWFLKNIPFFECSDKEIEEVYYYRWKLFKAHIRNVDQNQYVITEFINHVPWDREPYCTINAASMHHIYEGRWLSNNTYINSYINYLYQNGGNNRRYSESIADATYAHYLVNSDKNLTTKQLDSMVSIYQQWDDHFDVKKGLYYIPAMPDATEYNIAAIDASGGVDGFEDGEAFRPTINSYQFGNALAISKIAALAGNTELQKKFQKKADALRQLVQDSLWNLNMEHFVDRYKADNEYVHYWDFIRGRELAGYAPWYFNLPEDKKEYYSAWKHLLDTTQLLGKYGYRTNEPSYEYYFHQFLYYQGKPGSQWNGPSWPYQTSQALTGMINFLQNYNQQKVTNSDFLHALRLFTKQHFLPNGTINLVENYDPNKGGPIVYYNWSNHYLHSSYNNLVISGLCGVEPSNRDTLSLKPLIDDSIDYFCLSSLHYHGHKVTVVYDKDGTKYNLGKGLTVYVDGDKKTLENEGETYKVMVGKPVEESWPKLPENLALNIDFEGYPKLTASVNNDKENLSQAVDGRIWYFPEIANRWTTNAKKTSDWLQIEFKEEKTVSSLKFYPFVDNKEYVLPKSVKLEVNESGNWRSLEIPDFKWVQNTVNTIKFKETLASAIRMTFEHPNGEIALSEVEIY